MDYDTIIVGGGPAGLSAALVLGRARRRVLVCNAGRPRNAAARHMHGFLSRDGIPPPELLALARDQLAQYSDVEYREAEVLDARRKDGGFEVVLHRNTSFRSRTLLLATGVVDELPDVPGVAEMYGQSVHHCPYCDGWEHRDRPLAAYGRGARGLGLARVLIGWSRDVVVLTDGPAAFGPAQRSYMDRHRIGLRTERVARLEGTGGRLERVVFADGGSLERAGLFFNTSQRQRSDLAARLGCTVLRNGSVEVGKNEATCVKGVFVAGDASKDVQLAIVAAAEGAKAAFAINKALLEEDFA